jgi:hypothetical protein
MWQNTTGIRIPLFNTQKQNVGSGQKKCLAHQAMKKTKNHLLILLRAKNSDIRVQKIKL